MTDFSAQQQEFASQGFTVLNDLFSGQETERMRHIIDQANTAGSAFRRTADLFAIRRFLHEAPAIQPHIFTSRLHGVINRFLGPGHAVVKSIYFDKPQRSNWFVAWHQDLTISVQNRADSPDFGPWTKKEGWFAVRPPLHILENIYTIRIHLDDTDEENGALRVIPGSHRQGVTGHDSVDAAGGTICRVPAGSAMLMRPLLLHSSARSTSARRRRVIHLEFSSGSLPRPLQWAEYTALSAPADITGETPYYDSRFPSVGGNDNSNIRNNTL